MASSLEFIEVSFCLPQTCIEAAREANNRLVDWAYTEKWLVSAKSSPEEDAAFAMRLKASRAHIKRYADGRTESQWSRFASGKTFCCDSVAVRAKLRSAVLH